MNFKFDLFSFIKQESPRELKRVLYLASFVGLSSTLLIALVNESASKVADGESVTSEFFIFISLLIVFLFVARKSTKETLSTSQSLIHKFKMRLMRDVFMSDLSRVDEIGRVNILQALGRDAQTVSQAMPALVLSCQALATLLFLSLYMATISLIAFCIISLTSLLIFYFSSRFVLSVHGDLTAAWKKEGDIHNIFGDFLNGFKEIKMNSAKARDISQVMVQESRISTSMKSDALIAVANFFNYLQVLLYIVVGGIIFIVPIFSEGFSDLVVPATTVTIFLVGSLTGIITSIPSLSEANASAKSLLALEEALETTGGQANPKASTQTFSHFESLVLKDLSYKYSQKDNKEQFSIGPINYDFEKGKIYFIRGSNGSGKTTLIRILLGLYKPSAGEIIVNNEIVEQPTSSSYRDLFAVVFSDFHLFKNLYGLGEADDAQIESWRALLKIDHKVNLADGIFSNINLSTGQKKRLALLVAVLESRPVMVLDEWAADQDPEFRKIFYTELIPLFRSMGKTVIAITHDDQYFNLADRLITIDNGNLFSTN
jgi:putative ATP-binding cassette transporter